MYMQGHDICVQSLDDSAIDGAITPDGVLGLAVCLTLPSSLTAVMSVFNFAYTVPFPKDSKITWAQAFEGLRFKARDPLRFVPLIAACEVYEETPTYIKRKVSLKTGTEMVEDVSLHEPSLVCIILFCNALEWILMLNLPL